MSVAGQDIYFGGLETGGTTFKLSIAKNSPTHVIEHVVIPTTSPAETLAKCLQFFREKKVAAIGVASFGPVDLDRNSKTYGFITSTPKLDWQNTDVLGPFKSLNVPIGFNTDVNAAALAELMYGQHDQSVTTACYVTVGTGIGVGICFDGMMVSGLLHPEVGHIRVPRMPGDKHAGECPFHKDCLEGLCNSQAVATRAGCTIATCKDIPDTHAVWETISFYMACLCENLLLTVSPHVIVLGGGIMQNKRMLPMIRQKMLASLNGYVRNKRLQEEKAENFIVTSVFDRSDRPNELTTPGVVGALVLAMKALEAAEASKI